MFVSHVFKTEYLKQDVRFLFIFFKKLSNSYVVYVDPDVLKVFSQITKLIKINNVFNINSITVSINNNIYI